MAGAVEGLNPEIPLGVTGQQPQNALDLISRLALTQNALNANNLFQQEFAARKAMGPIMQHNISPTGAIDWPGVLKETAQTPEAAFTAPTLAQEIQSREQTQLEVAKTKMEMAMQGIGYFGNIFQGMLNKKDLSTKDIVNGMAEWKGLLHSSGLDEVMPEFSSEAMATELKTVPAGDNPETLRDWVLQRVQRAQTATDAINARYGQIFPVNQGSQINLVQGGPVVAPHSVGVVGVGMTPGEKNALIPTQNAQGQPQLTPRYAFPMQGQPSSTVGPSGGIISGAVASNPLMQRYGAPPPTLVPGGAAEAQPQGEATPNAVAPPPTGKQGLTTTFGPTTEQQHIYEGRGNLVVNFEKGLNDTVSGGERLMQTVNWERDLLTKMRAGGGAEVYSQIASLAQALHAKQSWVDAIANGNLAATQEFVKLSMQQATTALQSDMAGTAGKFALQEWDSYQKNNPRAGTDPRAIEDMFNKLTQTYNMKKDELIEWNKWKSTRPNLDVSVFKQHWQDMLKKKGYINPVQTSGYAGTALGKKGTGGKTLGEIMGLGAR